MAYVSSDGTVSNKAPWSLRKILNLILGLLDGIAYFFESLFGIEYKGQRSRKTQSKGSSFGGSSGGGGGGGGPFGPGGGGGGGPSKRIKTMRDINPPTMNAGGCPGGSCGM